MFTCQNRDTNCILDFHIAMADIIYLLYYSAKLMSKRNITHLRKFSSDQCCTHHATEKNIRKGIVLHTKLRNKRCKFSKLHDIKKQWY